MLRSRAVRVIVLAASGWPPAGRRAPPATACRSPAADTTSQGVLNSSGAQRFLAIAQGDSTVVMRVATGTGQLLAHRWIDGNWSVPGVAIDGDTSGISHDGSTLVLVRRGRLPPAGDDPRRGRADQPRPEVVHPRRRLQLRRDLARRVDRFRRPVPGPA